MNYPRRLIDLYAELGRFTWALCEKEGCLAAPQRPASKCCSIIYCMVAEGIANQEGFVLAKSTNPVVPEIPYLDREKGCLIPPHLRPICTRYQCRRINYIQFANAKDQRLLVPKEWMDEYDRIIHEINVLERARTGGNRNP